MFSRSARRAETVELALATLTGRWKTGILYLLASGCSRYVQLVNRLPGISSKVLTAQLRRLERDGLVRRRVFPESRKRVEYGLTPLGEELRPLLRELERWGRLLRTGRRGGPNAGGGAPAH